MCLMKCMCWYSVWACARVFWVCNNLHEVNMQVVSALSNTSLLLLLSLISVSLITHMIFTVRQPTTSIFLSVSLPGHSVWPFLLLFCQHAHPFFFFKYITALCWEILQVPSCYQREMIYMILSNIYRTGETGGSLWLQLWRMAVSH